MNTIVRQLHSEIYRFRKVIIFLLVSLGCSAVFAKKITYKYSVESGINFANQICYNPLNIENETYHWKSLKAPVILGVIEYNSGRCFSLLGKIGYEQKGFKSIDKSDDNQNQLGQGELNPGSNRKNTFHYSIFQAQMRYYLGHNTVQPFVNAGLTFNVLLATRGLRDEIFQESTTSLYDYHHFQRVSLGTLIGAGLFIDNRFGIAVDTNLDLTRSVNTIQLHVKNWVNSIKVIVGLNQFFE